MVSNLFWMFTLILLGVNLYDVRELPDAVPALVDTLKRTTQDLALCFK